MADGGLGSLIKENTDATTLRHYMVVFNVTSKTESINPRDFHFLEIGFEQITFRGPKSACAAGHHLSIYVFPPSVKLKTYSEMMLQNQNLAVNIKGSVIEKVDTGNPEDPNAIYTLRVEKYPDEDKWKELTELYLKRQEQINGLYARDVVNGEES